MRQPVGVLLAAGAASRFGGDKLLHPTADGTPLAVAALAPLRAALPRVLAVVRQQGELAEALRRAGAQVTVCPRAAEGMGASLAWAVAAAADGEAWVVGLADMPYLRAATVAAVAAALADGAELAAPVLPDGRRGHPVGFGARWRPSLLALRGDAGGRDLLRRHADRLQLLPTDDAGCLWDVDVPADLAGPRPEILSSY